MISPILQVPNLVANTNTIEGFSDLVRACSADTESFFFIQIGANDGKEADPLYRHVIELEWSGIMVEPQKLVYEERLIANYKGYKNLYFENAAIDCEEGQRKLFKLSFSDQRWATGLASFQKSHLEHHIENGYIERSIGNERHRLPDNIEDYITSEPVRTITFESLLSKYQVENLDLLQIDTEGYDYRLLQLFDFTRLRPVIIQFEHHVMTKQQYTESLELLGRTGYATFAENINTIGIQRNMAKKLALDFNVKNMKGMD